MATDELTELIRKRARLAVICERLGYLLLQAQELEWSLAQCLAIASGTRGIGEAKGQELLDKHARSTLGRLVDALHQRGVLHDNVHARFKRFTQDRNAMIHRLRREHRGVLNDLAAHAALCARLELIADEALALLKLTGGIVEHQVRAAGVCGAEIDAEAERILAQWGET